MVSSRTYSR